MSDKFMESEVFHSASNSVADSIEIGSTIPMRLREQYNHHFN